MARNVPGFRAMAKEHAAAVFLKMGIVAVAPAWNVDGEFVPAAGMRESEMEDTFFLSPAFSILQILPFSLQL